MFHDRTARRLMVFGFVCFVLAMGLYLATKAFDHRTRHGEIEVAPRGVEPEGEKKRDEEK